MEWVELGEDQGVLELVRPPASGLDIELQVFLIEGRTRALWTTRDGAPLLVVPAGEA